MISDTNDKVNARRNYNNSINDKEKIILAVIITELVLSL